MREAHVPAEHPEAQQAPRFPPPDEHARRPGDPEVAPSPRSRPPVRLIHPVRDRATFAALARSRPVRRGPISVRCVRVAPDGPPQVAYAVGRAVGGAVRRNRARRRLRAAVRAGTPGLAPGAAYLVGAGPEAVTMPFPELEGAVTELLQREVP
jgi:ribonuclease P protein component